MESLVVSKKGQIVLPARIRRKYGIRPGSAVRLIERDREIAVQPAGKSAIWELCGIFQSNSSATKELLRERARDKKRENEALGKKRSR